MTINFSLVAMDQIVNNAAKIHAMFGGQARVPLVIRTPAGWGQLAARISHDRFDSLDVPVERMGQVEVPMPYAKNLEELMFPDEKSVARRMTESKATAPHFYITVEINMDDAMKVREQLNALAPEEERISVNDLVVAAAARTLARFPVMNASYREGNLEMHPQVNIGIAVALEDGLIPPVLRDADK